MQGAARKKAENERSHATSCRDKPQGACRTPDALPGTSFLHIPGCPQVAVPRKQTSARVEELRVGTHGRPSPECSVKQPTVPPKREKLTATRHCRRHQPPIVNQTAAVPGDFEPRPFCFELVSAIDRSRRLGLVYERVSGASRAVRFEPARHNIFASTFFLFACTVYYYVRYGGRFELLMLVQHRTVA